MDRRNSWMRRGVLAAAMFAAARVPAAETDIAAGPFAPSWDSLKQYQCPDWFRDAKFGIFMHWGPCTVAEENGWYGRTMYLQDLSQGAKCMPRHGQSYEYHVKKFGHPSTFGYKDLIPRWKAEKWDPDALVAFYKQIGARYVVPVAVHHDNFDCYDSSLQSWNSVNMGPKRDVAGEWKKACAKHGLRFGLASHSEQAWHWFETAHGADVRGPLKGVPYDGRLRKADGRGLWWEGHDPQDLYCRPHAWDAEPDEAHLRNWYLRTKEMVDKYQPDLLYFDGGLPFGDYGLRIAAHLYNANRAWHGGTLEAVLNIKHMPDEVNEQAAVLDIERGQSDRLREKPWQTDTTVNPGWFYRPGQLSLTAPVIVHNLADIVSKNGNLLLNVGLRADGTLPDEQRDVLLGVGRWLEVNGEAIYGTRPWTIYGEGPTRITKGRFNEPTKPYTVEDIRFTAKGDVLYAILLGWPENGSAVIRSLAAGAPQGQGEITSISLLGSDAKLAWTRDAQGLSVKLPATKPCDHAYVLKITMGK